RKQRRRKTAANRHECSAFIRVHSRPFVVRRVLGNSCDLECRHCKDHGGACPQPKGTRKEPRIDANERESGHFFASICVRSWLEKPRAKTRFYLAVVQRSRE